VLANGGLAAVFDSFIMGLSTRVMKVWDDAAPRTRGSGIAGRRDR